MKFAPSVALLMLLLIHAKEATSAETQERARVDGQMVCGHGQITAIKTLFVKDSMVGLAVQMQYMPWVAKPGDFVDGKLPPGTPTIKIIQKKDAASLISFNRVRMILMAAFTSGTPARILSRKDSCHIEAEGYDIKVCGGGSCLNEH